MNLSRRIRRLTQTSVMAALIFSAIYFIKIPVLSGYIHPGDGVIFAAAAMLPAPWACSAAVIGACLADLLGGYPLWIPATLVIKLLSVLCFSHGDFPVHVHMLTRRNGAAVCISALIGAAGYWLFEWLCVYHSAAAAAIGIPFNLLQSAIGGIIFFIIGRLIDRYTGKRGNDS